MPDSEAKKQPDEEVQRVLDAIDGLGVGGSAEERARRLTELLDGWPDTHAKVREMRQQAVAELYDDGKGLSLRQIGARLDISFGRVRQILAGETAGPRKRKQEGGPNAAAGDTGTDAQSGHSS
ncbi:sigma factor-like helix-turn-helix DNA-binding protein [Streptomyces sp. NBC_00649]|uniref:sigma factor-like helix-turn-helix DNA-binding protein n=1 Tax=Streptomyces sp. NBC_00649 TaxID=2975798 RepID=UPI00324C82EC